MIRLIRRNSCNIVNILKEIVESHNIKLVVIMSVLQGCWTVKFDSCNNLRLYVHTMLVTQTVLSLFAHGAKLFKLVVHFI